MASSCLKIHACINFVHKLGKRLLLKKRKVKKNKNILLRCTVKIELGINQRVFFSELTFILHKSKYGSLVS